MSILKTSKDFAVLKSNTTFTASFTTTISAWTPAEVSPTLWLDASDTSTIIGSPSVDTIQDKSGNGYHFNDRGGQKPETGVDVINGNNVLTFTSDGLYREDAVNEPPITIDTNFFMVLSEDAANTQYRLYSSATSRYMLEGADSTNISLKTYNSGGTLYTASTSLRLDTDTPTLLDITRSTADNKVYFNKNGGDETAEATLGATDLETVTTNAHLLNHNNGSRWTGKFCEFIIVNGTMTTEEKQKMQGYLAHKWGLQNSLPLDHPYKTDETSYIFGVSMSYGDTNSNHANNPSYTYDSTPPYLINVKAHEDTITGISISGNGLTTVDVSSFNNLTTLNVADNSIPRTRMSQIFVDLDEAGQLNGTLTITNNISGNLTAKGTTAYNNLVSKGWTITGL